jgi:glyoxylase-like metal-dependent hydrolase (beta-lactamase superfamily II)
MRHIVPDVYLMEGFRGSNVYLLVSGRALTLVDSGRAGVADQITAQLQEGSYALSELHTIVLTHAHGDHTGSVAELVHRSGAQVLAHRDEVPYIERAKPLPAASLRQRLLNWLFDRVWLKRPPCKVDRALEDGDVIEVLGGVRVIHTPGHTPGSICLYQPERQILFCGDVLFNENPLTGQGRLQLSFPLFTLDQVLAWESVRKLSALPVEVLCFGHGEPILEGAGKRIQALLRERSE